MIFRFFLFAGNGLIDETEFLEWIARIQALTEDSASSSTHEDDLTQDLVAAFRWVSYLGLGILGYGARNL